MSSSVEWHKEAIIYEAHVRAVSDGNGDGIGDFRGFLSRLDYFADLGITTFWLLPFYPSPLRDDGYDITDYCNIHPDYGTLEDFRAFLDATHERGMRVVIDLVINHTSDQHPWFERARRAPPESPERNYYVWSSDSSHYGEAPVLLKELEPSNWSWDAVAQGYFWHRFASHQPDLNFDSPAVQRELFAIVDFWLELGVDGIRLDAVPYLFEREETNCENLPETHAFIKALRTHVDEHFPARLLVAEANQWAEDAAAYFGEGDECHVCPHYPIIPRLFLSLYMEDRFPLVDMIEQTPAIPPSCQWALFLRNHDELTLEMTSDEERHFMYRAYAQDPRARTNFGIRRRLAPLLGNNRRRIELLNALLFSLPGSPVIYYGDEIGMGDNIYLGDRNGVRTPMQWSSDRNAGFSSANPQQLYLPVIVDPEYHYQAINVAAQQANQQSLLWWMKRLIGLRKRYRAFSRGTLRLLSPQNRKIIGFVTADGDEQILVVANLSRFTQYAELDLSEFAGQVPVELFARTRFPEIGSAPYFFTFAPHAVYWFVIERPQTLPREALPKLSWSAAQLFALAADAKPAFERLLPAYLARQPWFDRTLESIISAEISFHARFSLGASDTALFLVDVKFHDAQAQTYLLLLAHDRETDLEQTAAQYPLLARIEQGEVLYDALWSTEVRTALLRSFYEHRRFSISGAVLEFDGLGQLPSGTPKSSVYSGSRRNSQLFYEHVGLKLFRRLHYGRQPDVDLRERLAARGEFQHLAPLRGTWRFISPQGERALVGFLQELVPSQGTAWQLSLDEINAFFERILATDPAVLPSAAVDASPAQDLAPPAEAKGFIGSYLDTVSLLAERTAELHRASANLGPDPRYAREPSSLLHQRALYQSLRALLARVTAVAEQRLSHFPPNTQEQLSSLVEKRGEILARFRALTQTDFGGTRLRCHGDLQLAQFVASGPDFLVIDFEGDPNRPIEEREIKRSPLVDVASVLHSIRFAATVALYESELSPSGSSSLVRTADRERLMPWVPYWSFWATGAFLSSYFSALQESDLVPAVPEHRSTLLDILLVECALHHLERELRHERGVADLVLLTLLDVLRAPPPEGGSLRSWIRGLFR